MPASAAALFVLVLAFVPGAVAESVARHFVGEDWRRQPADRVLRLLLLSLLGFGAYLGVAEAFDWPRPLYLFPSVLTEPTPASLLSLSKAYMGHVVASVLVGATIALGIRMLPGGRYPTAWDSFVHEKLQKQWAVVQLVNGDAYYGFISLAQASVPHKDRDLILENPQLYDKESQRYSPLPYREFFLGGHLVYSIAVVKSEEAALASLPSGPPEEAGGDDGAE